MTFCKNCGQELKEGAQFCNNCGTPVDIQPQQEQQYQAAPPVQQPQQEQQYQAAPPVQQVQAAPPVDDVNSNKGIAWLAYMGPLFLVPMFARKFSKYCQFHVRQGVVICATLIAYAITTAILLAIIGAIFPAPSYTLLGYTYHYGNSAVYNIFNIIFSLGYIFFTVFEIIGIVNAATGKENKLPIFGSITLLDPLMDKFYGVNK